MESNSVPQSCFETMEMIGQVSDRMLCGILRSLVHTDLTMEQTVAKLQLLTDHNLAFSLFLLQKNG